MQAEEQTEFMEEATRSALTAIDVIVKPLVWYSVAMLALECHLHPEGSSRESQPLFLRSERVVAVIFTCEYLFRWLRNSRSHRSVCSSPASSESIVTY